MRACGWPWAGRDCAPRSGLRPRREPARTTRGVGGVAATDGDPLAAHARRGHDARMKPAADDKPDDKPQAPACVVNAAVHNASGKLRDISLDEISDERANADGSLVWVGEYDPEDAVPHNMQAEYD